jgi:hypothetical protein
MRHVLALLLLITTQSFATPITFRVTFTVGGIFDPAPILVPPGSPPNPPTPPLINPPSIGTQYFATFVTDDSVLATDGINAGVPLGFHAQMGASVWDPNLPRGILPDRSVNLFAGFRGPTTPGCGPVPDFLFCLGSTTFGFDVLNHKVVGLYGGVYSTSDTPFIDFGGNSFHADPLFLIAPPTPEGLLGYHVLQLSGPMSIFGTGARHARVIAARTRVCFASYSMGLEHSSLAHRPASSHSRPSGRA